MIHSGGHGGALPRQLVRGYGQQHQHVAQAGQLILNAQDRDWQLLGDVGADFDLAFMGSVLSL